MTAPSPMSRDDLLELAALDALGLLDEYEADLYTRAFHHASATLQDEIREVQATFSSEAALLPDVEPREGLRDRVLAAMTTEAEAAAAPIATIGSSSRRAATATSAEGSPMIRAWSSAVLWRAASFALIGALVVVSYFAVQFRDRNDELVDFALGQAVSEKLAAQMGDEAYSKFLLPSTRKITLAGTRGHEHLTGYIAVHDDGQAYLIVVGKHDALLRLESVAGEHDRFKTTAEITTRSLGNLTIASIAHAGFQVRDALSGVVLMAQA